MAQAENTKCCTVLCDLEKLLLSQKVNTQIQMQRRETQMQIIQMQRTETRMQIIQMQRTETQIQMQKTDTQIQMKRTETEIQMKRTETQIQMQRTETLVQMKRTETQIPIKRTETQIQMKITETQIPMKRTEIQTQINYKEQKNKSTWPINKLPISSVRTYFICFSCFLINPKAGAAKQIVSEQVPKTHRLIFIFEVWFNLFSKLISVGLYRRKTCLHVPKMGIDGVYKAGNYPKITFNFPPDGGA